VGGVCIYDDQAETRRTLHAQVAFLMIADIVNFVFDFTFVWQ
jgi:hypothetical protein